MKIIPYFFLFCITQTLTKNQLVRASKIVVDILPKPKLPML